MDYQRMSFLTPSLLRATLSGMVETVKGSIPSEAPRPPPVAPAQRTRSLLTRREACRGLIAGMVMGHFPRMLHADESEHSVRSDFVSPKKGAIIIAGGGPHKGPIDDAFTLRAGKRVGIITTASGYASTKKAKEDIPYYWMVPPQGIEVDLLHPSDPRDADDASFADCIDDWTGAWIPGGVQERLEILRNTLVLKKLRKLWERGGVIGGTSAGAAVMGDLMIRKGYPEPEISEGFGFVANAVFDQHVDTRNRMERLFRAQRKYPTHVGVGITEETAIILEEDEEAEVIGKGTVNFHALNSEKPIVFYPGDTFNIRTGMVRRKGER